MNTPLWNQSDESDLRGLLQGVREGDLAQSLLFVEGAPLGVRLSCTAELARWSQEVASLRSTEGPEAALAALSAVLVDRLGLTGDALDYDHPRNSALSQVVSRRRGLPILLSAIWRIVGRGAGIPIEGIGLPFHFIARIGGPEGLLVDPFDGGQILSPETCVTLVERASQGQLRWRESFLEPTDLTATLERVLRNLMSTFPRTGDMTQLYRSVRFMAALRPASPQHQLALARLSQSLGQSNMAMLLYTEILERYPETEEAGIAERHLSELTSAVHLVN